MTDILNILCNSTNAALIGFTVAAAVVSIFTKSPKLRFAGGIAAVAVSLCVTVGPRPIFEWTVSAVERPSFPGFALLLFLAISTTTGRPVAQSAEFRFATLMFAIAGCFLYPAATGFFDQDPYILGFSGYLLPTAVALIIVYALRRSYLISALSLNVGIVSFLLNAGASRNLWDYIIDPVAWIIGCGTWVALAAGLLISRFQPAKVLKRAQPSSGIGETPISH